MDAIEVRIISISSQFRSVKPKIGSIDCGLCNKSRPSPYPRAPRMGAGALPAESGVAEQPGFRPGSVTPRAELVREGA